MPDLVAAGILHLDAQEIICGTEDRFYARRLQARARMAEFQRQLKEKAK